MNIFSHIHTHTIGCVAASLYHRFHDTPRVRYILIDSWCKKQEVWRVLTAMLSHKDIFHLLLNLTVLYEAAVLEAEWEVFYISKLTW